MKGRKAHRVAPLNIEEPTDKTIRIWRYMDFAKFILMLAQKGLYFVRCSLLDDKHEGSIPMVNFRARKAQPLLAKSSFNKDMLSLTLVNCWHMNDGESEAMWRLYGDSAKAIAIQSTFKRLRSLLDKHIICGKVHYIDYKKESIYDMGLPSQSFRSPCNRYPVRRQLEYTLAIPFMCKRKSFDHERELRAIVTCHTAISGKYKVNELGFESSVTGRLIPVSLNKLIENVYVSPSAPDWYFEAVQVAMKKFGLARKVKRSALDCRPLY